MNTTTFHISAILLTAAIICSSSCGHKTGGNNEYRIIPKPQKISYMDGSLRLPKKISVAFPSEFSSEASMLKRYMEEDFGMGIRLKENGAAGRIMLCKDICLDSIPGQYRLSVDNDIKIEAASPEGIFNGIQSLRQIIGCGPSSCNINIRKGEINDFPAFRWRAFMLDDARNFRGIDNVKLFLDEMARVKMNVFHWHLTDDQGWRIEIRKYPLLTEIGGKRDSTHIGGWNSQEYDPRPQQGFYTQEQIREVLQYARLRHITVVPEIEMPGHSSAAIAAYPWLGTIGKPFGTPCRFGYAADLFDVSNPEVISFLHDVLDEVMELFPGQVIHIGGDEVSFGMWEKSPSVRKYMREHNIRTFSDLQLDFTHRMSSYIASKGRRMMGWSDIGLNSGENETGLAGTGESLSLAEGTIIQFWKGDPARIKDVAEMGYDIVNSYNMRTYLDYNYDWIPLEKAYSFYPVPEDLPEGLHGKIIGFGCQLWTEWIMTDDRMFYQAFPRFAALAEAGWTMPENKDFMKFKEEALPGLLRIWDSKGINYGPADKSE